MAHVNIEIKARCADADRVRDVLLAAGADFRGDDHQLDTYFHCPRGRLKLRQGNIENTLIHYRRPDQAGPKRSDVILHPTGPHADDLKAALAAAMGVWVVVDKRREIYFIDNVKFHVDHIDRLGDFVEIEAIGLTDELTPQALEDQCRHYMRLLEIDPADLLDRSYSDMLAAATSGA